MVPPSAGKAHMQPGLEVIFKAAEKLLQQTACQSFSFQDLEGDQFNVQAHALSKLMKLLTLFAVSKPLYCHLMNIASRSRSSCQENLLQNL